jgi:hypothetical protein
MALSGTSELADDYDRRVSVRGRAADGYKAAYVHAAE